MSNLSDFLVSKGSGYGLREVLTVDGTWDWVAAGKPSKVFIRMIGGAGGNAQHLAGSNASDGGDTVWDTGAVVATTTAIGGGGATTNSAGVVTSGMPSQSYLPSSSSAISPPTVLSIYGIPSAKALDFSSNCWMGSYGQLKEFTYIPNGNILYTIGAGGTEGQTNAGSGQQGAIELYY